MFGFILFLQLSISQNVVGFADALMHQGDYFRAISEYKRAAYYLTDDSIKNYCLLQIARSYRKSSKFDLSIQYSNGLLSKKDVPITMQQQSNLNLGLSYLESHLPQLSLPYFQKLVDAPDSTGFPLMCMGLAELEMKNWTKASEAFVSASRLNGDAAFQSKMLQVSADIQMFPDRPQKSPLFASALSLAIPGSGQIYSGHIYDGIQAFLVTVSSAFATYALYKYEHSFNDHLSLTYVGISLTAIFEFANVLGAYQTANYHNWKDHEDFVKSVHDMISPYEP